MPPSHVLVALDGSPRAEAALAHALENFDCKVSVLNVVTPVDARMSEGQLLEPDEDRREAALERAERLAAEFDASVPTLEPAVIADEPVDAILDFLNDHEVDHVVIGGHGGPRIEIAERLLGTVATEVADAADVPVTIVREPLEE